MTKKQEAEQLECKLTALLGKQSCVCAKKACTGKYRGLYDYGLTFQDGSHIWISLGRKRYIAELKERVDQYAYFRKHCTRLEEQTRLMIDRDNRQATALGLTPVSLIRLELANEIAVNHTFWPRAILEQSGRQYRKYETMFKYACFGYKTDEYFAKKQNRPDDALGGIKELGQKEFTAIIYGYLYEQNDLERMCF